MIKKKVVLCLLLLALGFSAGYFLKPTTKETIPNIASSPVNPLAFFTTVDTPKGKIYLHIDQDFVYFNPIETAVNNNQIINIKKENYPKLFKQGVADSSSLRAEYYTESKNGETYIKLSNIQPDHGGYADTYAILADPFTGIVKESKSIDEVSGKASF